ncbi:MAG: iron chaperone [Bacteroidia bacterium]
MQSSAKTPDEYIASLPADRKEAMTKLRNEILKNLPKGFEECMAYGMIGYVVPLSIYPAGYHCDPKLPLGFANLGSQKNYISFHHMGIYGNPDLLKWFEREYPKHTDAKLDMGKGCIRFKDPDKIPYKLVGELMKKVSVKEWIGWYENALKMRSKKK